MSLTQLVHKAHEKNILLSALIELTYRCNLKCFFCYNDLGLQGRPLSKQQYFDLLDELYEMQVFNVVLSGGEPLAHPDFLEIGTKARELGFCIRIKSNGHSFHGELARQIKEKIDPFLVELSLHGATAETHERQTRVPGSFDRLIQCIDELRELGFRLRLNAPLTSWNEHELEQMIALAREKQVNLQLDPWITPRDNGDESPLEVRASDQAIKGLLKESLGAAQRHGLEQAQTSVTVGREGDDLVPRSGQKHCGAGSSGIAVDPYGNIYPCVQWRSAVGNLHSESLKSIWEQSTSLGRVREETRQVGKMIASKGTAGKIMNYCPGRATKTATDVVDFQGTTQSDFRLAQEAIVEVHGSGGAN